MPIFSREELATRWARVLSNLGEEHECLVVTSFHNSYYLSGLPVLQWGRLSVTMLFRDGSHVLITPDFEAGAAAENSPIGTVRLYRDSDGPSHPVIAELVADVLRERKVTRCALELSGMPASFLRLLEQRTPEVAFSDGTGAIDVARLVSSPAELDYAREASRIVDVGMQRVLELTGPGISERELALSGQIAMLEAGTGDYQLNVSCYQQGGARSEQCHGIPSADPLRAGELVEVICEAEVEYYQASLERPVIIGDSCPDEVLRACRVAAEAFDAALAAVRPGARFGDVDRAGREVLLRAGYDRIPTGAGLVRSIIHHSGGRTELGELRAHNDRLLEPEMVVTVEPWAIVPGIGGPRHCDVVRVTGSGAEQITRTPGGVLFSSSFGAVGVA